MFLYKKLIFLLLQVLFTLEVSGTVEIRAPNTKAKKTILDEESCSEVQRVCKNLSENDDILILECLQSVDPSELVNLNEGCQHKIWEHVTNITKNENVKDLLLPVCRNDLDKFNCNIDDNVSYLKCIVNNRNDIQSPDCSGAVLRLENIAFQDYRWISSFLNHCENDITKLSCGRIDFNSLTHYQTITCLQNNIVSVAEECRKEVFKLSEIQSDNIKLDRQLYLSCAEDHSRYCSQFLPGGGRVFKCLLQQDQNKLLQKCKQQLLRRQKLIAQDFRVSKGLMRACKEDIKKTHCRRQTSSDKTIRLSQILLCLENISKNGTRLESDCEAELADHRRMLMEDYRLSPEIVDDCKEEIGHICSGFEFGGKTIHCLMNNARPTNNAKVGDKCKRALEDLVKETDVGEDWRVDPILHQACFPVVKTMCRNLKGGDARVMSCLMDNIGTDQMTEECEDALIQIQYFVARDFKLDPQLYRSCRDDAARHCHVSKDWVGDEAFKPKYSPEVLPCLYRYANHPDHDMELNKSCLQQIRRVMRQRAISVDLQPEIEEACLDDLAYYCHDKLKKGEEIKCLQNNLEELKKECQEAVEAFTEVEAEHAELNPYIMKHCRKEMETICGEEFKSDEGDVMECLIAHKNSPSIKLNHACRGSIEHFQLISIKDYKFTYKFKMACKNYAMNMCGQAKTKHEVVACLSEQILNSTIQGLKSSISKECKQQLKAQMFQQRENINYDPKLKAACSQDIKSFCSQITAGNSEVLECLQNQREKLSDKCGNEIFKVKKQEMFDNSIDYTLNTICAETIDQFCSKESKETVLECLKIKKDLAGFNKKCRTVVLHRMLEQNTNYQLNPSLQQKCHMDITKFCKHITPTKGKDPTGPVIKCLKDQFKQSKLSKNCEKEMANILREQALNVNLNPLIRAVCKNELDSICNEAKEDTGDVEECLKEALLKKTIQTPACKEEVANMILESQADIQVDPLLQQACSLDLLLFCSQIPQGNGRHIQCLRTLLDTNPKQITHECKSMFTKRLEMYRNVQNQPEDLHALYSQVVMSPSKNYFIGFFLMVIMFIFFVGLMFGRVATRKYTLLKNK